MSDGLPEAGVAEPVRPRFASTVVLLRDASGGPETLLLKRPDGSRFAPGAWVFPGGAVDDSDADWARPEPVEYGRWSRRLGCQGRLAWAHLVAAIREVWEETGILLARATADAPDLERLRRELLGGRAWDHIAGDAGLEPAMDSLVYIARWITPTTSPLRYDTRFFLAPVDRQQTLIRQSPEFVDAAWVEVGAAVEGYQAGELPMLLPTVHTLRTIVEFTSVAEVGAALATRPAPEFLP